MYVKQKVEKGGIYEQFKNVYHIYTNGSPYYINKKKTTNTRTVI